MFHNLAEHTTGLGMPQLAERVEKRMVDREERENIITTGTAVTQDWDAAWESDGGEDGDGEDGKDGEIQDNTSNGSGRRNRLSFREERKNSEVFSECFSIPRPISANPGFRLSFSPPPLLFLLTESLSLRSTFYLLKSRSR